MTELDANRRYLVKVVRHDGTVCASGNFGKMNLAHEWIDKRRRDEAACGANAGHPSVPSSELSTAFPAA